MLLLSLRHTCVNKNIDTTFEQLHRDVITASEGITDEPVLRFLEDTNCHYALMMEHLNPFHPIIPKDLKYFEASDVPCIFSAWPHHIPDNKRFAKMSNLQYAQFVN